MTVEAVGVWLCVIAMVAVLFWIDFWLGIAAIAIIVGIFILAARLAFGGFRGS